MMFWEESKEERDGGGGQLDLRAEGHKGCVWGESLMLGGERYRRGGMC